MSGRDIVLAPEEGSNPLPNEFGEAADPATEYSEAECPSSEEEYAAECMGSVRAMFFYSPPIGCSFSFFCDRALVTIFTQHRSVRLMGLQ